MSPTDKIILLVDDDRDDRDLFIEAIELVDPSITCYVSADGKQALELLAGLSTLPQVIFLDINMPVMNGWQCLKTLKEAEKYKHIPVIMYSTSSHKREVDIALQLGALCFCVKPENFNLLKQILKVVSDNLDEYLLDTIKLNRIHLHPFKGIE